MFSCLLDIFSWHPQVDFNEASSSPATLLLLLCFSSLQGRDFPVATAGNLSHLRMRAHLLTSLPLPKLVITETCWLLPQHQCKTQRVILFWTSLVVQAPNIFCFCYTKSPVFCNSTFSLSLAHLFIFLQYLWRAEFPILMKYKPSVSFTLLAFCVYLKNSYLTHSQEDFLLFIFLQKFYSFTFYIKVNDLYQVNFCVHVRKSLLASLFIYLNCDIIET